MSDTQSQGPDADPGVPEEGIGAPDEALGTYDTEDEDGVDTDIEEDSE